MNNSVMLVAVAMILSAAHPASHAQVAPAFGGYFGADVAVVCPSGGGEKPMFKDVKSGRIYPIGDPHLRAVATKACETELLHTPVATTVPVSVTNMRSTTVYVSFTLQSGAPAPIDWTASENCTASGGGMAIAANQSCTATVPATVGSTRFCAALDAAPGNCWQAQANHQTMVETTFVPAANCYPAGQPCVYYDISVIPQNCTDKAWANDQCAGTGGASYNLPVAVACDGTTTFACMGPTSSHWGTEQYPGSCGDPNGICVGSGAKCVNAYFFPMFSGVPATHQPTGGCFKGKVFEVVWLSGS